MEKDIWIKNMLHIQNVQNMHNMQALVAELQKRADGADQSVLIFPNWC